MKLWHATTPKKFARYQVTGGILPPVRGWAFPDSATAWARRTGRSIILEIDVPSAYPLPDHKPRGHGYWHDGIVREWVRL